MLNNNRKKLTKSVRELVKMQVPLHSFFFTPSSIKYLLGHSSLSAMYVLDMPEA